MGDRIEVPLELTDFEVIGTELVDGVLEVAVRSSFPRACFHRGSMAVVGHGRSRRRIRDRSCSYPTVLVWDQRRHKCADCGRTSRERHPEMLGAKRVTARFDSQLADAACDEPWTVVAARERVSWWRVADSFDRLSIDAMGGPAPRVISIDEAAFKRGGRYQTVLTAPEQRRILDVVEGRDLGSIRELLASMPSGWDQSVETVVIDMFWPFRRAVTDMLPDARIVVDKFHVLRAVNKAAARVRIRNSRRRPISTARQGSGFYRRNPSFDPDIRRNRWLFMKRSDRLTSIERQRLDDWFELDPETGMAWLLKETFAAIYDSEDRVEAERRFKRWTHHVAEANIAELAATIRTVELWKEPIFNYFDDRQTNGYAEGITNKIKVLKRRGYGHRHSHRYRAKIIATTRHRPANPPPIA